MAHDQIVSDAGPRRPVLHIDLHQVNPDVSVVRLRGQLDRPNVPALASCLSQLLGAEPRCASVTIDLTETSFMDVGGLNVLLDAHRAADAGGSTVCLAGCSRQVLRLLQVSETVEVFRLVPNQRGHGGDGARPENGSTAHTDLPSSNSVTPHRTDTTDTTCKPRPRGARRSTGRGRGGGHR
jgi:anti-anti-sigma factor